MPFSPFLRFPLYFFNCSFKTLFSRISAEISLPWFGRMFFFSLFTDFNPFSSLSFLFCRGRMRPNFFSTRAKLELWVSSLTQGCKILYRAYIEFKLFTIKIYNIWAQAYFKLFWKLGSSSFEPGAYLLWSKKVARAFKPEPRLIPPLMFMRVSLFCKSHVTVDIQKKTTNWQKWLQTRAKQS